VQIINPEERRIMKNVIVALLSAAAVSQAAIVNFDLSPPGSSPGVGLSPLNEVPPATNSTGSGNALALLFDTETSMLSFAIGYGSAAGYTDLTAPATVMHIHGPAPVGSNASVVINLGPNHFPAPNPAQGGVIYGSAIIPTNAVPDLMAGLHYINIHTTNYPGGEIRGQLIRRVIRNRPPVLACPPHCVVECLGQSTTLRVRVSDPDGDPLALVWYVNGAPAQTNHIEAPTRPPTRAIVQFVAEFPLGTNKVEVAVADGTGNVVSCGTTVRVVDRIPPLIRSAEASPSVLWPPNHRMVDVRIKADIKDFCDDAKLKIVSVTSNEPVDGLGDGDTSPDWEITGDRHLKLRAERSGTGNGRIYTITVRAEDSAGNLSPSKVIYVKVPKSMGYGHGDGHDDDKPKGKGRP
jgi:hypothetical protein